jgi:hypothetical protein
MKTNELTSYSPNDDKENNSNKNNNILETTYTISVYRILHAGKPR